MIESTPRPSDHEFTIGWVCTLLKEYIASLQVLDDIYNETTPPSKEISRYYTLGRIGGHKVVISCCRPTDNFEPVSALRAMEEMKTRFTSMRFVVMVGIAGGAPSSKHDVRLGDVVIGTRVVQHRFGEGTSTEFKFAGHTLSPPRALLHAVTALKTRLFYGLALDESFDNAYTRSPTIEATFRRPEVRTDRLYKPQYAHIGGCDCLKASSQYSSEIIARHPRQDHRITVHDGVIGSVEKDIKDAVERDQLASELDALCFDAKVSGLCDSSDWIPIRGICGYSDSHGNEEWNGYAAAAAAVCARELLLTIPPVQLTGIELVDEQKQWIFSVPDFMQLLEKAPSGITTTMHSALIGICVLLAIIGQLLWSFYLWILSVAANIHSPDFNPPIKTVQPVEGPTQQFGGAPIHINIHVGQQAMPHARAQSEADWGESPQQCPTEFSTVQWNGVGRERVLSSTAELLEGVRTLMGKEIAKNISISIPNETGSPLSPVDSSCDPLERIPWQRQDVPFERTESVSSASKPPVPPRSKKPRGYVSSRRNTQIPVPNSMAKRNKYSAENKNHQSPDPTEEVPEIVALINEYRGRASMPAHGQVRISGQHIQATFLADGRPIQLNGSLLQSVPDAAGSNIILVYENIDDLVPGPYHIVSDGPQSYVGHIDLNITARNARGTTISLVGPIQPPLPSKEIIPAGILNISFYQTAYSISHLVL
ncbi:nucleoside phosphorylase domain-containing protein [Aspergillus bertholletiae]|uniref:Nucleoside phosphorylase domain-containing protein n=1 Tax=Aspergillus bertholletiae TaxID=1226010 RepID=A0A5N7AQI2_9EURO|nr:nucleoside phosphorylase domain-containing protein [Aspergillus bertholletiae]